MTAQGANSGDEEMRGLSLGPALLKWTGSNMVRAAIHCSFEGLMHIV